MLTCPKHWSNQASSGDSQNPQPLLSYAHLPEALVKSGQPARSHGRSAVSGREIAMMTKDATLPTPNGPGSVSGAPNLPAGFADTFTSRYIKTGDLRQHAVIGGEGPALLLVHGWPETWYAWRLLMPTLAHDFTVIAVDQRGIGLTDKPEDGYDTG